MLQIIATRARNFGAPQAGRTKRRRGVARERQRALVGGDGIDTAGFSGNRADYVNHLFGSDQDPRSLIRAPAHLIPRNDLVAQEATGRFGRVKLSIATPAITRCAQRLRHAGESLRIISRFSVKSVLSGRVRGAGLLGRG